MITLCKMTFKPSALEPWQQEDASRLKALFNKQRLKGMSQVEFGERFGIGNQGAVWQYLNGKRPLNIRAVAAFARGLGVEIADISPKLAIQLDAMNGSPRLRNLLEKCTGMTDEELTEVSTFVEFVAQRRTRSVDIT
ncbi:MAG: helix-turn-helix transcriptional regulator [Terriglobia bacterium]|nr:helix-turn-helix transcriptional regulator [Terriglobia bacterium]